MELSNATYLYTLALIAIAYVGFTAIVLILRQSVGGDLSALDTLVSRLFMGWGFLLTYASILPMAIAAFEIEPSVVWRVASVVTGLSFVIMQIVYPLTRARATGERTPLHVWLHVAAGQMLGLILLLDGAGLFPGMAAALYLAAVSLYTVQASFAFVQHFGLMIEQLRNAKRTGADPGPR